MIVLILSVIISLAFSTFAVVGAVFFLGVSSFLTFIVWKRKKKEDNFRKHGGWLLNHQQIKFFGEDELEKVTANYQHLIGQGGFGSVFRGRLPDETLVAVKKPLGVVGKADLNLEFLEEITMVSQVNTIP